MNKLEIIKDDIVNKIDELKNAQYSIKNLLMTVVITAIISGTVSSITTELINRVISKNNTNKTIVQDNLTPNENTQYLNTTINNENTSYMNTNSNKETKKEYIDITANELYLWYISIKNKIDAQMLFDTKYKGKYIRWVGIVNNPDSSLSYDGFSINLIIDGFNSEKIGPEGNKINYPILMANFDNIKDSYNLTEGDNISLEGCIYSIKDIGISLHNCTVVKKLNIKK